MLRLEKRFLALFPVLFLGVGISMLAACKKESNVSENDYALIGKKGVIRYVVIKNNRDDDENIFNLSDHICDGYSPCSVQYWRDDDRAPKSVDVTDEDFAHRVATYWKNSSTGIDELVRKDRPNAVKR